MKFDSHTFLYHALTAWRTMRLLGYIDPGSGSYAYQMVIAGLTGVLFFFSTIKRKFVSLFSKAKSDGALSDPMPADDPLDRDSKDSSAV
jgi:hypothetical protein